MDISRTCRWSPACLILALVSVTLGRASSACAQAEPFLGKVVALPNTVVEVTSPATGQIMSAREKPFTVGDRVKKGDPLAVIANRYDLHDASHLSNGLWAYEEDMLQAKYAAVDARIAREKAERLKGLGTASGQQVAELKAAEQVAQAEYEKNKNLYDQQVAQQQSTNLERRGLLSPIEGQISAANFTQGQMIYEGLLLYRIVDLKQVGITARVPESEFRPWPVGTVAHIHFDDLPGKNYTGKLEQMLPTVDPDARTREVLFRVDNPGELLRFGMIGRVEIK